ncbi:MAG: stage II sporulation protein M [Clostridiaceae bacterium]
MFKKLSSNIDIKKHIIAASLLLCVFIIVGIFIGLNIKSYDGIEENNISGLSGTIYYFLHNSRLILVSLSGIFLFGISSLVFIVFNGIVFGIAIGMSYINGMGVIEIILRLSHGILEIPSMILATAIGFLGFTFYQKKNKKEIMIYSLKMGVIAMIVLFVAAIFEANLTDRLVYLYKG